MLEGVLVGCVYVPAVYTWYYVSCYSRSSSTESETRLGEQRAREEAASYSVYSMHII